MDRRRGDLLQETRRLLNVLNEENGELKEQNLKLSEEIDATRVSKDRLEEDMKKVNLNLMDQLHKRTVIGKDLEKQLHELQEEAARESRRSTESLTRVAALEAENALLKESVRVLNEQCAGVTRQLALAEDAAYHSQDQLSLASQRAEAQFEQRLQKFKENQEEMERTINSLRQQLAHVSNEKGSLENTFNDLHAEHLALQRSYDNDLRAAQSESRRSAATTADVSYLHGQLLDHKAEVCDLFGAMRHYVQPLGEECERHGEELQRLQLRMTSLSNAFAAVKTADDNVLASLYEKMAELQRQTEEQRSANESLVEANARLEKSAQTLTHQLARYKREVGHLSTVFTELQEEVAQSQSEIDQQHANIAERDNEIKSLNNAVMAERRLNTQLRLEIENLKTELARMEEALQHVEIALSREKSESLMRIGQVENQLAAASASSEQQARRHSEMQVQYEEEIRLLRAQVDEHADTLANALGRLRSGSSQSMRLAESVSIGNSRASSMASAAPRAKSEFVARPFVLAATGGDRREFRDAGTIEIE